MIEVRSKHQVLIGEAAKEIEKLENDSIALVVTSPPYPMIEMWDGIMSNLNPAINEQLNQGNGSSAFELMHLELDKVWYQISRVVKPGGFACINIGDATRSVNENFALYTNHSRIISAFLKLGFSNMPNIIWRKQTNAPNKFMGSGMLPAGAYVTLEHEWILIFRKGGKRVFKTEEGKQLRRASAFFWEERNIWFSDLWDVKGTRQKIENPESRDRNAAYPFEIPYRLINMYSVKGDTVLDPFLGTGTTTIAAMLAERNSVGIEIDPIFQKMVNDQIDYAVPLKLNNYLRSRIEQHIIFVQNRILDEKKNAIKHFNTTLDMPVMTSQETGIKLLYVDQVSKIDTGLFEVSYKKDDVIELAEPVFLKKNKVAKKNVTISGQVVFDL